MLVSYNWLKDFLDLDIDPKDLGEKITRTGVEIASVEHPQDGLKKLVVGHVLDCEDIEGTHLHLTHVNVGEEEALQIVCGAPNVAAGQLVIVALPGARVAGNRKIKKGKIRGIESLGMICGLQEIGFPDSVVPKEFADGIYVFPEDAEVKPGDDVYEALGMDDYILDFDITPNRADTLSMEGAAYEVAAIVDQKPKIEEVVLKEDGNAWTDGFEAKIDEKLAPKFYLRKLSNVKVSSSPLWMQRRLWNAGIRPINNVVDVTNYVMLLTGQPMHAYDARSFADNKFEVRLASDGEKLTLLNDKEVELDSHDIVITNGEKPVMMAGVMGGKNSEVEADTTDVILEAAIFDGTLVRKSALRHANRTEASSRFEKGVNWDNVEKAINMAALLLRNDASATIEAGLLKATDTKRPETEIEITGSYINKVLGTELSSDEIVKIFDQLNFKCASAGDKLTVTVPNRRWDISIQADLVEEVGRIYGYDNIKSTQPLLAETIGGYTEFESKIRRIKKFVEGQGMLETISYSLTSPEKAIRYTMNPKSVVKVEWPLNSSRSALRQNLITGLVDAASYNMARKEKQLNLFEQSRVYDHEGGSYNEREHLAALFAGETFDANWQHQGEAIDFYYVKGKLEELFLALGIDQDQVEYKAEVVSGMHPTRTAAIYINKEYLGLIGMIDRVVTLADKSLRGSELYVYELDLDVLSQYITKGMTAKPAPKFPSIERDLSLLVDKKISSRQIENVIKANGGKYLHDVKVIDVYEGSHIDNDAKSLAYKLVFLNEKDTLTDEVVTNSVDKITDALVEELEVKVR